MAQPVARVLGQTAARRRRLKPATTRSCSDRKHRKRLANGELIADDLFGQGERVAKFGRIFSAGLGHGGLAAAAASHDLGHLADQFARVQPFFTRSSVTAAMSCTLPSSAQPTTTTALAAFCRSRSTCCRICSSGPEGISPTMILRPADFLGACQQVVG